jgi:hypothetical protein
MSVDHQDRSVEFFLAEAIFLGIKYILFPLSSKNIVPPRFFPRHKHRRYKTKQLYGNPHKLFLRCFGSLDSELEEVLKQTLPSCH